MNLMLNQVERSKGETSCRFKMSLYIFLKEKNVFDQLWLSYL